MQQALDEGPDIGTPEFNELTLEKLYDDIDKRFLNCEIYSLHDYMVLLDDHKMNKLKIKVQSNQELFERELAFRTLVAEENRSHIKLKDVLNLFIEEE